MSRPTSTRYVPRQDATRENEIAVLASIYKIALDSANKNAVAMTSTDGSDAMKGSRSDRARTIIPPDK